MAARPVKPTNVAVERLPASDAASALAPFIYFEDAPAFGTHAGIIRVTLDAVRIQPASPGEGVKADRVIVAHLRMSVPAAKSLRTALDRALLLAAPTETGSRN